MRACVVIAIERVARWACSMSKYLDPRHAKCEAVKKRNVSRLQQVEAAAIRHSRGTSPVRLHAHCLVEHSIYICARACGRDEWVRLMQQQWPADELLLLHQLAAGEVVRDWCAISARLPMHSAADCAAKWADSLTPTLHISGIGSKITPALTLRSVLLDCCRCRHPSRLLLRLHCTDTHERVDDQAATIECCTVLEDLQSRWRDSVTYMPTR